MLTSKSVNVICGTNHESCTTITIPQNHNSSARTYRAWCGTFTIYRLDLPIRRFKQAQERCRPQHPPTTLPTLKPITSSTTSAGSDNLLSFSINYLQEYSGQTYIIEFLLLFTYTIQDYHLFKERGI